ncbi:MAG: alpha/beta fold hydrolase [Pseudomonadota bacterium]
MNTHHVRLGGQDFFVRSWGDRARPALLMLHGFPEYSGAWADVAERLQDRFFCVAPDQRGYGQSWAPQDVGSYTTSKLVGDMAALIASDLVGGGPVSVFGHDWGAGVAYGLAMFRPALVSRLIIANGVHPVPFQRALARGGAQSEASQYMLYLRGDGSEAALAADGHAKLLSLFSAKMDMSWLTGATRAAYLAEWARPGRLRGMINWYRASPLVVAQPGAPVEPPPLPVDKLHVRCPHLLIWGMGDTALLPEVTDGLEDFAPALTRVELSGVDHWLLHQDPDAVARAVLDWHP